MMCASSGGGHARRVVAWHDQRVRFPVERRARPTLELLRELAPGVREVLAMADALGVEAPDPRLRDEADAEMAEWIVNQVPPARPERAAMLASCREEALARAISACRAVHDASLHLTDARLTLVRAQTEGGYWITPLRERVETLTEQIGLLLLTAHARAEEAEGIVRAVDLARSGQPWTPFDVRAATDWLIEAHAAAG